MASYVPLPSLNSTLQNQGFVTTHLYRIIATYLLTQVCWVSKRRSDILLLRNNEKKCSVVSEGWMWMCVSGRDSDQSLGSVLTKLSTHGFGLKISIEIVSGRNCFNRFKMRAILNISRTIKLKRLIIFESQSYQTKYGKSLHNFSIYIFFYTYNEKIAANQRTVMHF